MTWRLLLPVFGRPSSPSTRLRRMRFRRSLSSTSPSGGRSLPTAACPSRSVALEERGHLPLALVVGAEASREGGEVVVLERGGAVIFPNRHRPVAGARCTARPCATASAG